jgi:hypothetical protein
MRKLYLTPDWDGVLWDFQGGKVNVMTLPLSEELRAALVDWLKWAHGDYMDDLDHEFRDDFTAEVDCALIEARGIELWKWVRRELAGHCEVSYVSCRFHECFSEPDKLDRLDQVSGNLK